MNEILDNMSLAELSNLVKDVMARIYNKLREEEEFSGYQHGTILSMGPESYNNDIMIIDALTSCSGLDWPKAWFI
jgi:hypothetical protein